jgi:hypothetical protein
MRALHYPQFAGCVVTHEIIATDEQANFIFQFDEHDHEVNCFDIDFKVLDYFPKGINKRYWNLKMIRIANSGLKRVTGNDLKNFSQLQQLSFIVNKIEAIEANLFSGNPDLYFVTFEKNRLKFIHPDAFDHLESLEYIDFKNNYCIGNTTRPFFAITRDKVIEVIQLLLKESEWLKFYFKTLQHPLFFRSRVQKR